MGLDCVFADGWDTPIAFPGEDHKQSGGEAPIMLLLCGMLSTPPLPSIQVPLWPRMVAPDSLPSMGQIEQNSVPC